MKEKVQEQVEAILSKEPDMALGILEYIQCPECLHYQSNTGDPPTDKKFFTMSCQKCGVVLRVNWNTHNKTRGCRLCGK